MLFHRLAADGAHVRVPLEAGEHGFCVGKIGDETISTEVSDLFLEIKKRPAAAMTKRPAQASKHESKEEEEGEEEDSEQEEGEGKATEEKEGEEEEEEEKSGEEEEERAEEVKEEEGAEEHEEEKDEGGEEATEEATEGNKDAAVAKRYGVMYYKNGNCIGIRQKNHSKSQVMNFGGKHCGKSEKELRAIAAQVVRNLEEGLMSESSAKAWAREQVSS